MIKIIKPGYRKEVECIKCGALLSYDEKEDVQKEQMKFIGARCVTNNKRKMGGQNTLRPVQLRVWRERKHN